MNKYFDNKTGSYVIKRSSGVLHTTYTCSNYYAVKSAHVNGINIYQTNGNYYGTLTRNSNNMGKNHILFESIRTNDFFIVVNSKYGSLENIEFNDGYVLNIDKDCYGVNTTYENRLKTCRTLVHNSNMCLIYPKHNLMPVEQFIKMYAKVGIINGLHFKHSTNVDVNTMEKNTMLQSVLQNAHCSAKNFVFNDYETNKVMTLGFKFDKDAFYIEYDDATFTYLHSFLVFLSHCF